MERSEGVERGSGIRKAKRVERGREEAKVWEREGEGEWGSGGIGGEGYLFRACPPRCKTRVSHSLRELEAWRDKGVAECRTCLFPCPICSEGSAAGEGEEGRGQGRGYRGALQGRREGRDDREPEREGGRGRRQGHRGATQGRERGKREGKGGMRL